MCTLKLIEFLYKIFYVQKLIYFLQRFQDVTAPRFIVKFNN